MWKPRHLAPIFPPPMTHATTGFLRARRVVSLVAGLSGRCGLVGVTGRCRPSVRPPRWPGRCPRAHQSYELPSALVTPGFVDGHTHFALWALNRRRVQLAGAQDARGRLAPVAAASPVQGWVIGQGWDANGWPVAPERSALDAVQRSPVYLDSLDVHAAWVNSAALAAAGITRDTAGPIRRTDRARRRGGADRVCCLSGRWS